MSENLKFLAFDTSTDRMSIALTDGQRLWQHEGVGGAQSSITLIPAVLALLAQADMSLAELRAIVFGRGPGSFSGLRTACAVAQGLAFGAGQGRGIPVLPVDSLMALAEQARFEQVPESGLRLRIDALLDARMDEMYYQGFEFSAGLCRPVNACRLVRPENLLIDPACDWLAGNVFEVYADRLPSALAQLRCVSALPSATALLRLAPGLAAAGHCVPADQALPQYIRDKVALTTAEREQVKFDKANAALSSPTP
ncbi:tRNA threonylcarbamoyladenosine biosynthesis protein TsaB [Polaromonas vacuolata]|uniref:tRNA threonylcarbamoyladenosine biosynthesis protein TsaB n=1 Tax=Polaromonas vacuolata TaxID=37448 RepID=A0A6H2HE55_9BURK|nr:tRNA (adenosine(37)-N6)-threonylcarbamoyltransferase complex dimerization subunit type 1 TsaB [Polaromonas vacuolata]QJC58083.1 tRNA threonylcarbamoyladenosine biosynthesis protein TsaB [Polaromonas vacuolata]